MASGLRCIVLAFGVIAASFSQSLPIIWQSAVPASVNGRLVRDSASNLYFATTTTSLIGRQLNVQKFNALGTKLWEVNHNVPGNLGNQYTMRDVAMTSSRVFVLYQERSNNGNGTFVASHLRILNLTDGSLVFSLQSNNTAWESVAANESQVAILGKTATADTGSVSFYNVPAGSFAGVAAIGDVSGVADVQIDASGNAYSVATDLTGNSLSVVRSTAAGGVSWQTTLNDPARTVEFAKELAVDLTASKVYVLGQGNHASTGIDAIVYTLNSSNGTGVTTSAPGAAADLNLPGDLTLVPSGGFVVSIVNSADTLVARMTSVGATSWSSGYSSPPAGYGRSHAFDVDGNLLVLSASNLGESEVVRFNIANGTILGSYRVGAVNGGARELVTDAAGNFYINTDQNQSAVLLRSQPARLTFSANNVTGGTPVNGVIALPDNAPTNQLWTLASSNSSAASVPANVTLTSGNNSVSFPIVVNGVTANTNVAINARHNGFITQTTLTLIPSNAQAVVINPNVVVGGTATQGTVTLSGKAPTGGRTVTLASNKTNVATVPASVLVSAGQSSANFTVTTFGVNANQGVVVTATTGAVSKTAFFAVNAPSLTSISVSPTSIKGGLTAALTLNINGVAPTGGFSIVLFSGAPGIVILTASGVIPAGQTTHNVNAPTSAVTSSTTVTLFATRSGIYRTTTLTVTP